MGKMHDQSSWKRLLAWGGSEGEWVILGNFEQNLNHSFKCLMITFYNLFIMPVDVEPVKY